MHRPTPTTTGREDRGIDSKDVPFLKIKLIAVSGGSSFPYLAGKVLISA